ncbi:hypothetical protein Syun_019240 [Stephania yunnanensis]|uniref:Uncharacterized protein n=1 Tax=Stephania yunnanensis TaxID=152371 RepID=A0AAP0IVF0_9MAGN
MAPTFPPKISFITTVRYVSRFVHGSISMIQKTLSLSLSLSLSTLNAQISLSLSLNPKRNNTTLPSLSPGLLSRFDLLSRRSPLCFSFSLASSLLSRRSPRSAFSLASPFSRRSPRSASLLASSLLSLAGHRFFSLARPFSRRLLRFFLSPVTASLFSRRPFSRPVTARLLFRSAFSLAGPLASLSPGGPRCVLFAVSRRFDLSLSRISSIRLGSGFSSVLHSLGKSRLG